MTKNLMTHIVAGYPSLKESERIAQIMLDNEVRFLEVQIPFSDPVADGKTILRANQVALENGIKVEDCFLMMKRLSKYADSIANNSKKLKFASRCKLLFKGSASADSSKILFMTYFNIAFNYGLEKFCKKAKDSGCWGVIIPDIPIDEEGHEHYLRICEKYGLMAIQVISPITPERRLKMIAKVARGVVYCVSHTGTTGAKKSLSPEIKKYLRRVRKYIDLPIAVGFGISGKKQVQDVLKVANVAVIGSELINTYDESGALGVEDFLQSL